MSNKRKDTMNTPLIDNEPQAKATCNLETTKHFIQAYLDQVYKGEHTRTTLTKKGWINVITQFNVRSGRQYANGQLKNKWDNLKRKNGLCGASCLPKKQVWDGIM